MTFQHAVLWMDHRQAVLLGLAPDGIHRKVVHNKPHHYHRRHDDSLGSRAERDRPYFAAVAEALGETPEILLLGPGEGRIDFMAWLQAHLPGQAHHVLKSMAWDQATDDELAAEGRRFFRAADRMLPANQAKR